MNELTIGDKIYVSTKRAAEITGYAKDYVGQLCREGHVEAKMVGRSWYVLESSIREHRFGKQEAEIRSEPKIEAPSTPIAPEISIPATWEPSTYVSEPVTTIPKITPAPKAPVAAVFTEEPALTEMQSAWKEWFDTRKTVSKAVSKPEIEEKVEEVVEEEEKKPDIMPRREERSEVVDLPIRRIEPRIQPIRQAPRRVEPARIVHERVITKPRVTRRSNGSNLPITALLVVIAGLSIAVAAVGTGYSADYLNDNAIIRFLGGTSTVSK